MAHDKGLADRLRRALPQGAEISERRMFGGIAFMVRGNMCCGVTKQGLLMLRLGEEAAAAALARPHARPMDFTGRPMKSMIFVDAAGVDSDEALRAWVAEALAFARTLQPK